MPRRTIALTVGSREYKVVSSASEEELTRLATTVHAKLSELIPTGKAEPPQALLLAALALAHDLEEQRAQSAAFERKSRDMLRRVLVRLDNVLDLDDGASSSR